MTTPIQALEQFARRGLRSITPDDRTFYRAVLPDTRFPEISTMCSDDRVAIAQERFIPDRKNRDWLPTASMATVLVGEKWSDAEPIMMSWSYTCERGVRPSVQWLFDKILMPRRPITDEDMFAAGITGSRQDSLRKMMTDPEYVQKGVNATGWVTDDHTVIVELADLGHITMENNKEGIYAQLDSFASDEIQSPDARSALLRAAIENNNFDVVVGSKEQQEADIARIKKQHPRAQVVEVSPAYPGEPIEVAIRRVIKGIATEQ